MTRALSAFTAAFPLLALSVGAVAPASAVTPEDPLLGFQVEELPPFVVASQARATLSNGKVVGNDGLVVRRFWAGGPSNGTLGVFPSAGQAGFVLVDPTETFVLASQSDTGRVWRMELDQSGATQLATVAGAFDAAWETPTTVLITGDKLTRLDLATGATTALADFGGEPGPIVIASDGGVLVAPRSDQQPVPVGSSAVYRIDPAKLVNPPTTGYVEEDGIVVIEVESATPVDQWKFESSKTGFTGDGYFRWDGPNYFNTPGIGVLDYPFQVTTGGRYDFVVHNRHDHPESDKENDIWVRMDNGPWLKCFSNGGWQNVGVWNWLSWFDYSGAQPNEQAYFDLAPGQHTLQIAARSYNFHIDRFHLYLDHLPNPWDTSLSETVEVGLGLDDATFVIGGFTDARDLVLDGDTDLLVADTDPVQNTGRVLFVAGLTTMLPLVTADVGEYIDELEYTAGSGPATFQPFQPAEGGELRYLAIDAGGDVERQVMTPDRMELELTGPGTSGVGNVTATVKGGVFGAAALMVYGPAHLASSVEVPVPGLTQLLTGLDLATVQIATGLLPFDLAGNASVSFSNASGQTGIAVLQALMWSPSSFEFVATSEPATL